MKCLQFNVLVTLLTFTLMSLNVESYGQSKKEIKLQKQAEFLAGLKPPQITVTFDSQPQGAKVVVDGNVVGITPVTTKLNVRYNGAIERNNARLDINSYLKDLTIANEISVKFIKEGYILKEEKLTPNIEHTYISKPFTSGDKFTWPNGVFATLQKDKNAINPAYAADNSIPKGEAQKAVNRDNPGQTALERTIIRWYFESAPKGALVFWRVISSVPSQVKPTNESFLGHTPYEETRSFNIQGLTYENSRDVQIEVKVRRKGYLDQTKRFNVRQAIDQLEISSFFDLVKEEE